jgi:hypothetical protein
MECRSTTVDSCHPNGGTSRYRITHVNGGFREIGVRRHHSPAMVYRDGPVPNDDAREANSPITRGEHS